MWPSPPGKAIARYADPRGLVLMDAWRPQRSPCAAAPPGRHWPSTTTRSAPRTCASCSPTTRERGERLTLEAVGIYLDYSKNRVTDETLRLLLELAEQSGLRERIDAMFAGEKINVTEDRAVLHVALRAPRDERIKVDGIDVVPGGARGARPDGGVRRPRPLRALERAHRQADPQRRQHRHRRLGPRPGDGLRGAARTTATATLTFRFVSNVDGTDFAEATRDLDPAETLFIVSSKTFTTLETMTNADDRARLGARRARATRRRSPSTSSRCRPTPTRSRSSASTS